ncbi:MAG: MerR family transcriptional regulator [Muribaculaceae bacterium]
MDNITDKKYYKISEVADILGINASTLRFWEKEFTIIKPTRNSKNTRFYTPEDIETIRMVYFLVKEKGLKLDAAQQQIKVNRHNVSQRAQIIDRLKSVRTDLEALLSALNRLQ